MGKRGGVNQKKRPDIAYAMDLGWYYCGHSGSGHVQFKHPGTGFKLTLASSLSEHRGVKNAINWIRKNTP